MFVNILTYFAIYTKCLAYIHHFIDEQVNYDYHLNYKYVSFFFFFFTYFTSRVQVDFMKM